MADIKALELLSSLSRSENTISRVTIQTTYGLVVEVTEDSTLDIRLSNPLRIQQPQALFWSLDNGGTDTTFSLITKHLSSGTSRTGRETRATKHMSTKMFWKSDTANCGPTHSAPGSRNTPRLSRLTNAN
jgi:hypothetical protein